MSSSRTPNSSDPQNNQALVPYPYSQETALVQRPRAPEPYTDDSDDETVLGYGDSRRAITPQEREMLRIGQALLNAREAGVDSATRGLLDSFGSKRQEFDLPSAILTTDLTLSSVARYFTSPGRSYHVGMSKNPRARDTASRFPFNFDTSRSPISAPKFIAETIIGNSKEPTTWVETELSLVPYFPSGIGWDHFPGALERFTDDVSKGCDMKTLRLDLKSIDTESLRHDETSLRRAFCKYNARRCKYRPLHADREGEAFVSCQSSLLGPARVTLKWGEECDTVECEMSTKYPKPIAHMKLHIRPLGLAEAPKAPRAEISKVVSNFKKDVSDFFDMIL